MLASSFLWQATSYLQTANAARTVMWGKVISVRKYVIRSRKCYVHRAVVIGETINPSISPSCGSEPISLSTGRSPWLLRVTTSKSNARRSAM